MLRARRESTPRSGNELSSLRSETGTPTSSAMMSRALDVMPLEAGFAASGVFAAGVDGFDSETAFGFGAEVAAGLGIAFGLPAAAASSESINWRGILWNCIMLAFIDRGICDLWTYS